MKRAKATPPPSNQIAISSGKDERSKGLIRTVQRTSGLEAPIMSLAGAHSVCRFQNSLLINSLSIDWNARVKLRVVDLIPQARKLQLAQQTEVYVSNCDRVRC